MSESFNDKNVDAPTGASPGSKKKYTKREPIYDVSFSFTDSNMARAKMRNDKKLDRRYDEKVSGLAVVLRNTGNTFYAFKNVPMYNKKRNSWEKIL